jgi:hypothetical protein
MCLWHYTNFTASWKFYFYLTDVSGPVTQPVPSSSGLSSLGSGGSSSSHTNTGEGLNSDRKRGKKRRDLKEPSVLTDSTFIEGKNKKLMLEIDTMQKMTKAQEEREALEFELLRSKIAEVNSRKEFFETLTKVIKKRNSLSLLESFFEENED